MKEVTINTIPGIEEWRTSARLLLNNKVHPNLVIWQKGQSIQKNLFSPSPRIKKDMKTEQPKSTHHSKVVKKSLINLLETALCHSDPKRFDLCYRILWRTVHDNQNLLHLKTDKDVMHFIKIIKAVRRDAYKITAFLRFREITIGDTSHFVAWYEPEHFSLELKLNFFKTRFKNMRWSILTPYRAAHWNMQTLKLEDNPDPSLYPQSDKVEQYWLTYYANIFNPARTKKNAMLSQMPRKYWKNMPETVLIEDLLKQSESKTKQMIINEKN